MKVLVIDGDPNQLEMFALTFRMRWPDSSIASSPNGYTGIQMVATELPALVILDADIPDIDGFRICQEIRHFSDVPVIFVTAWDKESDIVHGLRAGADDYILKPFQPLEFIARVRSVLRRTQCSSYSGDEKPFQCGHLAIDFRQNAVFLGEQLLNLTPTEYRLLYHLVKHAGQVLPTQILLGRIWGRQHLDHNNLKVHVKHLRQKLGEDPTDPRYIVTERGVGYKFAKVTHANPTPEVVNPPGPQADVPIARMGEGFRNISKPLALSGV